MQSREAANHSTTVDRPQKARVSKYYKKGSKQQLEEANQLTATGNSFFIFVETLSILSCNFNSSIGLHIQCNGGRGFVCCFCWGNRCYMEAGAKTKAEKVLSCPLFSLILRV